MKTTIKAILVIAWLILGSICWCNPERLVWKIVLTSILLFIGWLAYAIHNAKEIDDKYEI